MILTELQDFRRYLDLHPLFSKALHFLESHKIDELPAGRTDIDGDSIYVNHIVIESGHRENQLLEMHREYIDIHIPIHGSEMMGCKATYNVSRYMKKYSYIDDCALSDDPYDYCVTLTPGMVAVVWPEDAHAPCNGDGPIDKLVMKIRI